MNRIIVLFALACTAVTCLGQTPTQKGMITMTSAFQYVSIPDSTELVPTAAMTIEAWFYLSAVVSGDPTIVRKSVGFPSTSWLMRVEQGGTLLKSYITVNGDAFNLFTATVPSVVGAWHHMATTFDGTIARMYLDGVQVATDTTSGSITFMAGDLVIGRGAGTAEQWIGSIDEVRLWSVARTAAQIQAARFTEIGATPGLLDVWRLNGNYQDSIGTHHGSPMGAIQMVVSTSPVVGTYLTAPAIASIGSPLIFQINSSSVGQPYAFDISLNGSSPGIPVGPPSTLIIPLNPPWVNYELGSTIPPGVLSNFFGIIPPSQQAFPTVLLPNFPWLVGLPISSVFALLDPMAPLSIGFISNPGTTMIAGPAPQVTGVSPATSPVGGGAVLTITGAHFLPSATVQIGGVAASNVTVNGPNSITATTPPGTLGPTTVKVTNPDTTNGSLSGALTYVPNLVVSGISPLVAPPGATVTITGAGFVAGLSLSVAGIAVTPSSVLASSIAFQVPAGVPCNASVIVVNPDQQTGQITWNPGPSIVQIVNNTGSANGGGSFFLLGTFTPGSTVTVGGVPATATVMTGAILVVAPPGTVGPQPVIVTGLTGCPSLPVYYVYF